MLKTWGIIVTNYVLHLKRAKATQGLFKILVLANSKVANGFARSLMPHRMHCGLVGIGRRNGGVIAAYRTTAGIWNSAKPP